MSATQSLFEFQSAVGSSTDALFLERLESFMEKSLSDIEAFAERESQPYEETRRYVAEWHAKNLFLPSSASGSKSMEPRARPSSIQSVLRDTSRILESLSTSSGVQSFLLAVDPFNPSDGGFLGGSLLGREFWRGFRGGGENGARSFKTHCTSQLRSKEERMDATSTQTTVPFRPSVPPAPKTHHAKSLKNELYESVRSALRSTSGVRTAEMKWTNPERLDVFGVRLVGWPEGVPSQNPSSLKSGQNRLLLDALQNGMMRFERLSHEPSDVNSGEGKSAEDASANETAEDFSWAYDADACPSSPIQECTPSSARSTTIPSCSTTPFANETPSSSLDEHGENPRETWNLEDHIIGSDAHYSTGYTWGDEIHDSTNSVDVWGGADGEYFESERPRKRLRSEEPPVDTSNT